MTTTAAPDLLLLVHQDTSVRPIRQSYQLRVGHPRLRPALERFSPVHFPSDVLAHVRTLASDIETLPRTSDARDRLAGIGAELGHRLLPPDLRRRLWQVHRDARALDLVPTLYLLSDETLIPWELVRLEDTVHCPPPGDPEDDDEDGAFLVDAFAFTRWLEGPPECLELPLGDLAVVVPRDSRLTNAAAEREGLLALAGAGREVTEVEARYADVTRAMGTGRHDGWHFTGHGLAPGDNPLLWNLKLENWETLRPTDLRGQARKLGRPRPLVFLNSCRSGQGGFALTGTGGWSAAFLEAGAGAFLGSLWEVADEPARVFAEAFYGRFLAGTALGEAVRAARRAVREACPDDPTWAAYTVFGHPLAVCRDAVRPVDVPEPADVSHEPGDPPMPGQDLTSVDPIPRSPDPPPAPSPDKAYDVFLSYNSQDRDAVVEVARSLRDRGVRVWLDKWSLTPGTVWQVELEKAIGEIGAAAVFVGRDGQGPWQKTETRAILSRFTERDLPVIPILLPSAREKPELPLFLTQFTWIELRGTRITDEDLDRLVSGIRRQSAGADTVPVRRPWRRLRSGALVLLTFLLLLLAVATAWESWPWIVPSRPSVAVLSLRNESPDLETDWLSTALSEILATELGMGYEIETVDRMEVVRAESGLELTNSESLSPADLARLRQYLGVEYAMVGAYSVKKTLLSVDLSLYETSRGGLKWKGENILGSTEALFDLVHKASPDPRELLGAGGLTPREAEQVEASYPSDSGADRFYSEGLAALRRFEYTAAREPLESAIEAEPDHPLPHLVLAWVRHTFQDLEGARESAARALDHTGALSDLERLRIEAISHELRGDWAQAVGLYRELFERFPGSIGDGLRLADKQIDAGGRWLREAPETLERVRGLPSTAQDPRLDLAEADALALLGDSEAALRHARQAEEKARKLEARRLLAIALLVKGSILLDLWQDEEAEASLREAEGLFQAVGDALNRAQCLVLRASLYENDQPTTAEKLHREAITIYTENGHYRDLGKAQLELSWFLWRQGREQEADQVFAACRATLRKAQAPLQEARALLSHGAMLHEQGLLDEAQELYEEALPLFEKQQNYALAATTLTNLGEIFFIQGDLSSAGQYHARSHTMHAENQYSDPAGELYDTFRLGKVLAARGDLLEARERYNEALEVLDTLEGEERTAAEVRLGLAELEIMEGNFDVAERTAEQAEQSFRAAGDVAFEAWASALRARSLLGRQRPAEAVKAMENARELAEETADFRAHHVVTLVDARVRAAIQSSDLDAVLAELEALARSAAESGYVVYAFESRLALGELELAAGRTGSARTRLRDLADEADEKGFGFIARRARQHLSPKKIGGLP